MRQCGIKSVVSLCRLFHFCVDSEFPGGGGGECFACVWRCTLSGTMYAFVVFFLGGSKG